MANEELHQRNYVSGGKVKGGKFGDFEELNIGGTSVRELKAVGVDVTIPDSINYPFSAYKAPKKPASAKPDRVFLSRRDGLLVPVATAEHKAPKKLRTPKEVLRAAE